MTNAERYKTASERRFAYQEYINKKPSKITGEFLWLELEYEEELKPCPFCGGEAERSHQWVQTKSYPVIRCKQCDAITKLCKTCEEAITAWNRRT